MNQILRAFSSLIILLSGIGISSVVAQVNPNDAHKSKGDERDTKVKTKVIHSNEFDESGLNICLETIINGTFIVHQQTYGMSRLMPYSASIKFAASALMGYNFNQNEGIVLGFGYCGGGQNYHDYLDGLTYSKSVSMSYIQFPVMFKYIFNTETTSLPYAMAGVQGGFLTSSKAEINGTTLLPNNLKQGKTASTKFFKSNDLGLRVAVGEDFLIGDQLFFNAGIEAYAGLRDINNPDLRHTFTFHANSYNYKKSSNFITGIEFGIHYLITGTANSEKKEVKKSDKKIQKKVK